MFCDMSPEQLENKLNGLIRPNDLRGKQLEVDMSKYDKSQGELLLKFEIAVI